MEKHETLGRAAALVTVAVWGTTFLSTKLLLAAFTPAEILLLRFVLGFLALCAICPRRLRGTTKAQELTFAAAGLCGVCLYYLLENLALTMTRAANVGVILSTAPFFTAILARLTGGKEERLRPGFLLGFGAALAGVGLVSWSGAGPEAAPLGDLLALGAAFVWACYGMLTRRIAAFGGTTVQTTRRVFAYGLLFLLPTLFFFDVRWDMDRFCSPENLFHLLFLGVGASALCFVTWNFAVKTLGAVKTSAFIYLVPVVTTAASALVLKEEITGASALGTALILAGLALSEKRRERTKPGPFNRDARL